MDGSGCYVSVNVENDEITIYQDYLGSYGLYLYHDGDYFAISNSFLKLIEYLYKNNKEFSLNSDYANYYLAASISSLVPDMTLVNEVTMLKHNFIVHINKTDKSIDFEKIDYGENTVKLNSREGIEILDKWYYKWIGLFRSIFKSNHITFDLSGGFDSRVIASLWITANMNLNNLTINSSFHNERFNEDLEIASMIAKHFDFKLNNEYVRKRNPRILKDSLNAPYYVKFGFHKKRYFPHFREENPYYRVSGHCGGTIRNYPNIPVDEYVDEICQRAKNYDNQVLKSTKRMFNLKVKELSQIYGINENSKRLSSILYRESRNRHHFGKAFVEGYLKNWITLAPLSDSLLSKLKITTDECDDDLLVITLIISRYCPDLLDFKVERNRKFNHETIEYAKIINEKYPFNPKELEYVEGHVPEKNIVNKKSYIRYGYQAELFKEIFSSKNFIKDFEKYFSKKSYNYIRRTIDKDPHYLQDIHAAFDILKVKEYIDISNTLGYDSIGNWFENYPITQSDEYEIDKLLDKYRTLRVDIINKGQNDNDFELIESSDIYLKHSTPDWFKKDDGIGHVLKTQNSNLKLKLKAINDGMLRIKIRAENIKDVNGNHFPVYVDCMKFELNGESIIDENTLISLDGFTYIKDVKDGDTISINIDWLPFNKNSVFTNKDVDALERENKILKKKLASLEKENSLMKESLDNKVLDLGNLVKKVKK